MVKFNSIVYRTKSKVDYIYSDLWGLSCVASKGGS